MTVSEAGDRALDSGARLQGPPLCLLPLGHEAAHVLSFVLGHLPYWDSCSLSSGKLGHGDVPGRGSLWPGATSAERQRLLW